MPLYTSLAPNNNFNMVYEQQLVNPTTTVALRPLSLPGDWLYIKQWLYREFAKTASTTKHLLEKHLRETLSCMLQCDFAQPFIGLLNDQPAFLVEICDGDKQCDALDDGPHIFEKGDHTLRFILSATAINTRYWSAYALFSCLNYFFSHKQVHRIVWELHERDKYYINLANQLSFTTSPAPDWPGVHVYLYSREKFTRFSGSYHQQIQKLP